MKTKDEINKASLKKELRILKNKLEVKILSVDEARSMNAEIMRIKKELTLYYDYVLA